MPAVDLELHGAIYARLIADATVNSLVHGAVYDQPPEKQKFPNVSIGEAQFIRDDAVCISGGDTFLTLHAWSRAVGFPEVKTVAAAVADSLHLAPLTLTSARLVSLMHRQTRVFRDADGLTSHAVIEFVANTETLIA